MSQITVDSLFTPTTPEESPPTAHCPHNLGPENKLPGERITCAHGQPLRLAEVLERFEKEATEGFCDTGRYRCHYFSWGSGPPLVFIHGLCDDARSFVMPSARLSEHFQCISYDLPQGGTDGAHLGKYHHPELTADLFALIDHLQFDQAVLFGSSFGSTIALAAMHQAPARFPRGIMQGGFARRPLAIAETMLASWARYWPSTMDHLPWREEILKYVHYAPFAGREPEVWRYFLGREGEIPIEAVARCALILHQLDLRPILPEIRQPIMLICGDRDPLVGKSCERELLEGLPHACRAELAGCGHIPQFSHPEALVEVVEHFLNAASAGA